MDQQTVITVALVVIALALLPMAWRLAVRSAKWLGYAALLVGLALIGVWSYDDPKSWATYCILVGLPVGALLLIAILGFGYVAFEHVRFWFQLRRERRARTDAREPG